MLVYKGNSTSHLFLVFPTSDFLGDLLVEVATTSVEHSGTFLECSLLHRVGFVPFIELVSFHTGVTIHITFSVLECSSIGFATTGITVESMLLLTILASSFSVHSLEEGL
jgi:hypothetical protein